MMNGQPAFISAIHHYGHPSNHPYQQFAIEDIGPASASSGLVPPRFHHQQHHAASANGNLGLGLASFVGQQGACGSPAGLFHPLPLPFRPAVTAGLPANYNTAGQAVAHQHQFVRSAIRTPQRMASYSAQQQQDDELARLQELSNKWEADATVSYARRFSTMHLDLLFRSMSRLCRFSTFIPLTSPHVGSACQRTAR